MKRVLIACVNHNSYSELDNFLHSVDVAASHVQNTCKVVVLVADNSTEKQDINTDTYANIHCIKLLVANMGYLNSAQKALEQYGINKVKECDFTLISNVDIEVADDFFVQLIQQEWEKDTAWIAPRIYTPSTDTEENPLAIYRYSKQKLQTLCTLYKYPCLHRMYVQTCHKLIKHKRNNVSQKNKSIYAGHGSIFIFTQSFIERVFPCDYPIFLDGEENYFGELVLRSNMHTIYNPNIKVINTSAHVSTEKIQHALRCQYSQEAIRFILNTFY